MSTEPRHGVEGHGTQILAPAGPGVTLTEGEVREVLGTRFLSDPNFTVSINGIAVNFEDISSDKIQEITVNVPSYGVAKLVVIDTIKADKTTRQHGVAWWVDRRLVGAPSWNGFPLDGRTSEAKRFLFIVEADFLADANATTADWSGFDQKNEAYCATVNAVHDAIHEFLRTLTEGRRTEAKAAIRTKLRGSVRQLAPASRARWSQFVDQVIDDCPSISEDHIEQIATILAKLELSSSQYGLLQRLHQMQSSDFDQLHELLQDWTVRSAKIALDEIQTRLKLIAELDQKLRDNTLAEVGDLQPLLERSLWVFGPEFESLEFTSNRGMTEVISKLFGKNEQGSRLRPDFAILPDSSIGFYSRDSHDLGHEVDGISLLVIAEIKRAGVQIGAEEKGQPWRYVSELKRRGHVTDATKTVCYVLGSHVDPNEVGMDTKDNGRVTLIAMTYNTFIRRAEKRMLGLRDRLRDAPYLREFGLNAQDYLEMADNGQTELAV